MKNPFILDGTEKPMARARETIKDLMAGKDELVLADGIKIWRPASGGPMKVDRPGQPTVQIEDLDIDGLLEIAKAAGRPSNPFLK